MVIDTHAYDSAIRRRNRQLFDEIRQAFLVKPLVKPGEMYDRPALPGGSADNETYLTWLRNELQRAESEAQR